MIENFFDSFLIEIDTFIDFLPRLLIAIVIALIIYLIGRGLSNGIVAILRRKSVPETYHLFFKKLISGTAVFIGFVIFLNLIGYTALAASLVAGGGLTAVMLGFAFKDIGENFLAGFFLAFSRPFNTNDVIESGGIMGRVKSIQLRHTHIRTGDGCDVFVPSAQLFTKPLHNYTLDGLRRGGFTVGIDYADDSQKALEILAETTKSSRGVLKSPGVTTSIKGFTPDYVELQIFFWINAKDQELGLARVRTNAMNNCRLRLIEEGYTISSDVKTAIELSPVDVLLNQKEKAG
jgi:small conductance mechanosensitive channel